MKLSTQLYGETFAFRDVKDVLARANEPRSGDVQAGLAPRSMREMAAAKWVLAHLTCKDLRENPSVPYEQDEVTRVVEDGLNDASFARLRGWTVAEFREWLLDPNTTGADVREVQDGITPEMAAAAAKLMTNMDLVMAAKKLRVVVKCNNTLGLEGRISSRLQPNHPRDAVDGVLAAVKDGLSFGNGDAVIGVNPATGSIQNIDVIAAGRQVSEGVSAVGIRERRRQGGARRIV